MCSIVNTCIRTITHTCWLSVLRKPAHRGRETAGELFCHPTALQQDLPLQAHGYNLHSTAGMRGEGVGGGGGGGEKKRERDGGRRREISEAVPKCHTIKTTLLYMYL